MGHPLELESGGVGRWSLWPLGEMGLQVGWCISESGRVEGSSWSRRIVDDGVARAGVWSLRRNLIAQGESLQLLGEIGSRGLACS
ncbi:hypothetical protein CRG98_005693 [Punica granatum]|uniref:Uncharacterized protein n=1 Tax=Punica granatum TaxID=22663 RepID=A0A2I0KZQ0_PUNGR|nr:hypothetical protein CRG98_005693 [Punica granatum]